MQRALIVVALALVALLPGAHAHAQSDTDRLREALRSATAQTRALEDQRASLQAKLAEAEGEKTALRKQVEAARARAKEVEDAHRKAVEQFNQRLTERDETLEKWKAAYAEAATVARAKDAERLKFEREAVAHKAIGKALEGKNARLIQLGRELMTRYERVHFGDMVAAREPLIGFKRVEVQNLLQDHADKILEQKAEP